MKLLLAKAGLQEKVIGNVITTGEKENVLAIISDVKKLIESINISEIIFCQGTLSYSVIIDIIQKLP